MEPTRLGRAQPLKQRAVVERLRELVVGLAVGDRLPAVPRLAEHFAVSVATVVSAQKTLEAEGWLQRRHGAGTFITQPGESKPTRRPGFIAVLANVEQSSHFLLMVQAIEKELHTQGRAPLLIFERQTAESFLRAQAHWSRGEIAGFIQVGSILSGTVPSEVPGVVIGEVPEGLLVHQVSVDSRDGGRQLGEHLWNLGHRRVALVCPQSLEVVGRPRFQGLCESWQSHEAARPSPPRWLPYPSTVGLEETLNRMLAETEPITALVAVNDKLALRLITLLHARGLRVPEDISVTGFDADEGLALPTGLTLTTVGYSSSTLGGLAAQRLAELLTMPGSPPSRLHIPVTLIPGSSTAATSTL